MTWRRRISYALAEPADEWIARMELPDMDDLTMDAMAELLNMGMGKAASELSVLVDCQEVEITVPTVRVVPLPDVDATLLRDLAGQCHGYRQQFIGDFEGNYLVAFTEESVDNLMQALSMQRLASRLQGDTSLGAVVAEIGYIMTNTTFGAVSSLLSSAVLSDRLDGDYVSGSNQDLVRFAVEGCDSSAIIACEIEFSLTEHPVVGQLLLVLTKPERFIDLVNDYVASL